MDTNSMVLRNYVRLVFVSCFVVFIINRFAVRPWILTTHYSRAVFSIAYSLPNFIEAIMGAILITAVLFVCRQRFANRLSKLTDLTLYLTATMLTATYVLSQEFKLHNIGGNNVYDPNDVIASILGLVVVSLMLIRFGLIVPQERPSVRPNR